MRYREGFTGTWSRTVPFHWVTGPLPSLHPCWILQPTMFRRGWDTGLLGPTLVRCFLWDVLFFIMFAETPAWPASALDRWPGVFPNGVFIHLHLCEQQSCWTRVKNPMFSAEAAHRSVFLLIHHPGVAFTSSAKTHGIPSTLSATEAANGAAVARSCSPPEF